MKVSVTARHFDLTADLKSHTEDRLTKFARYSTGLLSANVVLETEKYRQIAEISVHGRNGDYTAKAVSEDMNAAIDGACEKVEKQIRRHSDKTKKRSINGESKEALSMAESFIPSERKAREMMTVAEATHRVEEGEELVVFADTDSGATRVVYRRPDGTLKLIEVAG